MKGYRTVLVRSSRWQRLERLYNHRVAHFVRLTQTALRTYIRLECVSYSTTAPIGIAIGFHTKDHERVSGLLELERTAI